MLNCYDKLFDDVENHKKINWGSDVKNCLIDLGFNEIWNAQRCNEGTLCVIKQRIFDQAKQEIFACFENSSKCSFCRYLISQHCLQCYLTKPIPAKFQKCISKIRLSSHILAIETGRFNRTTRNQRKCIYCNINCVEDEFHFLLVCPLYDIFRKKYIKPYFWRRPSTFKLVQLLSSENVKIMINLGKCINNSLKLRNDLLP